MADAFILREQESYLSTNWLEHFHPADRDVQLAGVRQTLRDKGFRVAHTGHFVALNVGNAVDQCRRRMSLEIRFINLGAAHDPSHTGIYGLEPNVARAARVLAQAVNPAEVYPAG